MTTNSNNRRKKFASKKNKPKSNTKTRTNKKSKYWEHPRLRRAILATSWRIVDVLLTMDIKARLLVQPDYWFPISAALKKDLDRNFDLNEYTEEILGYSPLSDEWDDRYDNLFPLLRGERTEAFFEVKILLEQTINALLYLMTNTRKKGRKRKTGTQPYQTLIKCSDNPSPYDGGDKCFKCGLNMLQRMEDNESDRTYLKTEHLINTNLSRMTMAITTALTYETKRRETTGNHQKYLAIFDKTNVLESLLGYSKTEAAEEDKIALLEMAVGSFLMVFLNHHIISGAGLDPDSPDVKKNTRRIRANVLSGYDADDSELEDICYVFNYILGQEKKDFLDLQYAKFFARYFS
jgi:hypothetical protein